MEERSVLSSRVLSGMIASKELFQDPAIGPSGFFGDRLVDEGCGALRVKPPHRDFPAAKDSSGQCFRGQRAGAP
jgi:hypothetical protein